MKKLLILICGILILSMPGFASAGQESGLYIGGSLASSSINISQSTIKYDDNDLGYKIFAGYNFGIIPFIDLGVEGSYIDFGEASYNQGINYEVGVTGWDLFAVGAVDFGPLGVFLKVGQIWWDSDSDVLTSILDNTGSDMAYGLGLKFKLLSLTVRAEYEYFDTDMGDLDFVSVGLSWTF